nr:histidine kinase [uncultured Sphaerochaeta sp.]
MRKNDTLVSRITVIFLLTIMIAILSYTIVVMKNTYDLSKKQMKNLTKALSENVMENTNLILENMDRATIILLNSQEVRDAIQNLQNPEQDYFSAREDYDTLVHFSFMVTTTREFFITAYFGAQGDLLVSSSPIMNENPNLFSNTLDFQEGTRAARTIRSPNGNSFSFGQIEDPIVSIRPMLNPSTGTIAGYVAIFIDANQLMAKTTYPVVDPNTIPTSYSTMILDRYQKPVGEPSNGLSHNLKNYVSSTTKSNYTEWSVTVGLPVNEYIALAFKSKLAALLLPLVIVLIATVVLLRVLRRTLYPLNELIVNLENVRNGDYSKTIDRTTGFSDIDIIFSDFNAMTKEIDRLINTVYANELMYHKVQLQMLKLQINPHFLYNTLQTIEAMGEINNVPEVSEISHLLGKILRYNLKNKDIVPLSEELQSVRDFLKIQQIRFEETLVYVFQIAEDTKNLEIPKFILQPVIENCVVHGQGKEQQQSLIITISSSIQEGMLYLKIKDNGKGISAPHLQELRSLLENDDNKQQESMHIGLLNVNKRLKTRFGSQYGLIIESREEDYTEITYLIPVENRGA